MRKQVKLILTDITGMKFQTQRNSNKKYIDNIIGKIYKMKCRIRKWELSDAKDLATALSNKKEKDNLRDGLPYPYTEQDGRDFISAMISADENEPFAFAITVDNVVIGSISIFGQSNIHRQTAEIGYCIAEEYWGKSIMIEAVK